MKPGMGPAVEPDGGRTAAAAVCRGTIKQECIPVGCVPPALYRTGVSVWGVSLDRDPPGQRIPLDRDPLWSETPCGQRPLGQRPPCEHNHRQV